MNWETPPNLFEQLHAEFAFTVDAAATEANAKLPRFWSVADDALRQSWRGERVFCYPPTIELDVWSQKAVSEVGRAELIVFVCPAATETKWWQRNIVEHAALVRFVKGKVQFHENDIVRDYTYGNGIAIVGWWPHAAETPVVEWGYTWPARPTRHRSGWTGA